MKSINWTKVWKEFDNRLNTLEESNSYPYEWEYGQDLQLWDCLKNEGINLHGSTRRSINKRFDEWYNENPAHKWRAQKRWLEAEIEKAITKKVQRLGQPCEGCGEEPHPNIPCEYLVKNTDVDLSAKLLLETKQITKLEFDTIEKVRKDVGAAFKKLGGRARKELRAILENSF